MPYDRFMIAPFETGLQTDARKWRIMDDAFSTLNNAFVFRGRLRKRFGSTFSGYGAPNAILNQMFSRVAILLSSQTDGSGDITITVPGTTWAVGQQFSIGTEVLTVITAGVAQSLLTTGASVSTFDTTNGQLVVTGAAATTNIYYYTAQPIMGLTQYQVGTVNNYPSFAFDTQFVYKFSGGRWLQETSGSPIWHGSNSQFFWDCSWTGVTPNLTSLFVTNFNATLGTPGASDDPLWLYAVTSSPQWSVFTPYFAPQGMVIDTGAYVQTARIIVPFKDRLVLLNTIEGNAAGNNNTAYVNRARFCHNGSPFAQNAWYEPNQYDIGVALTGGSGVGITNGGGAASGTVSGTLFGLGQQFRIGTVIYTVTVLGTPGALQVSGGSSSGTYNTTTGAYTFTGATATTQIYFSAAQSNGNLADGGGYLDAATEEQIVSAEFIKDRLIVYFERSTWELAYTGNQVLPFLWQKINTELGSEATFSTVPFDKEVLTVGNTGIHSCNGSNVIRIDDKIPQQIFDISNLNQGTTRVAGIRDYYTETVYWTFPSESSQAANQTFPNRVLVYNYKNQSWAFNDDSFTCFSYFQQQQDSTWALSTTTWAESNFAWNSAVIQDKFRNIIAGNQQGFITIIEPTIGNNSSALSITEMAADGQYIDLQIINHNLAEESYIVASNAQGVTGVNGIIVQVFDVIDSNTIRVKYPLFAGSYTGGGTVARVSNYNIYSKQWNPYVEKGRNFYLAKMDFGVLRTTSGQVTVDYFTSAAELSLVDESMDNGSILGTNVLETSAYTTVNYEQYQDRLWHTLYTQGDGECVQIRIYMSDAQITNPAIAFADFEIEGIILNCMRSASRLQ